MSPTKPKLKVTPELCEGCRPGDYDCERACKQQAIRVGNGFVYVDWERCDGCLACVEMCETGALEASGAGVAKAAPAPAPTPVSVKLAAARAGAGRPPAAKGPDASRGAARPDGIWTEIDGIIALVVMLGALFVLNTVMDMKVVTLMPPSGQVLARAAGLAIAYAIELVVIVALARRHGVGLGAAFGLRPMIRSAKSAVISTALVLAALVVTRILTSLYGLVTTELEWQPVFRWENDLTRVFGGGQVGLVLAITLVVIFGPFVEELTFRGVVQSAAQRRWSVAPSIIASSALFAVYHFDPWMFAPTFVLGLALGWLAEKRQGLWPPIALHVLYNGITVVAVFWLASH